MNCKDCKYWKESTDKYDNGQGLCSNEFFIYSDDDEDDREKLSKSLVYSDYECYSAGFRTGPLFGCVHFAKI